MSKLSKLTIKGYKSIQNLEDFELINLNILLGANGAGKSNFISVFKLLANIYAQNLQLYVHKNGGADALLHYGRKKTEKMSVAFYFNACDTDIIEDGYSFSLIPTLDNRVLFEEEAIIWSGDPKFINGEWYRTSEWKELLTLNYHYESELKDEEGNYCTNHHSFPSAIESWRIYHFHDTSDTALVKQSHSITDNLRLKTDAANLAAFLFYLNKKHQNHYQQIVKTIQLVAPFFHNFVNRESDGYIQLEWFEKGDLDTPFKAHVLSDGTLRFMCLATLLLQPFELMSDTILIDEPELGLHPYALAVLADLIKRVAEQKQVIISTQSVELIEHFSVNDIIVVDRVNEASTFKRLNEKQLKDWLEDYTLGELWKQNIIGGRPAR
jgi:predicted ATPase